MNNVIMFTNATRYDFDTVKEAQEHAATLTEGDEFSIFTLYTKGTRAGIIWETQVDTGTNLREIKKAEAKKGKRGRGKSPAMKPDPNAKWFCENTTATIEPMWRGPKGISFTFDIRNDGTAPLRELDARTVRSDNLHRAVGDRLGLTAREPQHTGRTR